MTTKHTQGPWSHETHSMGQVVVVTDAAGTTIARMTLLSVKENEANARLIAVAPEMLEALEAIVFQVVQGKVLERDACITQARAAIAKSKG